MPDQMTLNPLILGIICCVFSALGYTAVNICLRFLSVHSDRVLVICVKELVTVAAVGPWLGWQAIRGRSVLPPVSLTVRNPRRGQSSACPCLS